MFLRLLLLLLLALNLGVGSWLLFGNGTPPPPATDPGVAELHLLSEAGATTATLHEAPEPPARQSAVDADERCFSLGPFPTEADVRAALHALTPHVSRVQYRTAQTTASRGWWVYLPAFPSRDKALVTARSLAAQGVQDYYVVTAGDNQNTISLGLFHDQANAQRRQAQIAALGVKPKLAERTEQVPLYYVDYALAKGKQLTWADYVSQRPDLKSKPMGCF